MAYIIGILIPLLIILFASPCWAAPAWYWFDDTGTAATIAACKTANSTPPSGSTANYCGVARLAEMNAAVVAGDTVYFRGGSYTPAYGVRVIQPLESGTSGSPITYSAYPGEVAIFNGGDTGYPRAVDLAGVSYIKITGYDGLTSAKNLKFYSYDDLIWIWDGDTSWPYGTGSDHCEVSYCEFSSEARSGSQTGSVIWHNSTYNWIHHNLFRDTGHYSTSNDSGQLLNIGHEDCGNPESMTPEHQYWNDWICDDYTNNNVIENNVMYHGGHHAMLINNRYNVVRNNNFHNEQWYYGSDGNYHAHRVITMHAQSNESYMHAYNLVEGNTISHSSRPLTTQRGGAGIHLGNSYSIIRQNDFYVIAGNAFYIESHGVWDYDTYHGKVDYNHIYNNTFFDNGWAATWPGSGQTWATAERAPILPLAAVSEYDKGSYHGNVFKNNIFWGNYPESTSEPNIFGSFTGCSSDPCGDTIYTPNWNGRDNSNGDPLFTSVGSYTDTYKVVRNTNWEWYWYILDANPPGSNTPPVDITSLLTQPDLTLKSTSTARDTATHLTTVRTGDSGTGTTLEVVDSRYFQPGWGKWLSGGPSVAADWIAIGATVAEADLVQISSITDDDTIVLANTVSRVAGDKIWLYKKSDGVVVLAGSAPDYGAHEYTSSPSATGCTINGATFR